MAWLNHMGMDSFSLQHAGLFKISMQFLLFLVHFMTITPALWNDTGYLHPGFLKGEKRVFVFPKKKQQSHYTCLD